MTKSVLLCYSIVVLTLSAVVWIDRQDVADGAVPSGALSDTSPDLKEEVRTALVGRSLDSREWSAAEVVLVLSKDCVYCAHMAPTWEALVERTAVPYHVLSVGHAAVEAKQLFPRTWERMDTVSTVLRTQILGAMRAARPTPVTVVVREGVVAAALLGVRDSSEILALTSVMQPR